jgi:hypothetical protein
MGISLVHRDWIFLPCQRRPLATADFFWQLATVSRPRAAGASPGQRHAAAKGCTEKMPKKISLDRKRLKRARRRLYESSLYIF